MRASHAPPQPCASPDPPGHSSHGHCTAARALSSRSSAAHPLCSFSSSCIWCTRSSSFSAWGITERQAKGSQEGAGRRLPCERAAGDAAQWLPCKPWGSDESCPERSADALMQSEVHRTAAAAQTHLLEQLGPGGHVEVRVDALLLRVKTRAACIERPACNCLPRLAPPAALEADVHMLLKALWL